MRKYIILYHSVDYGAHIFSTPSPDGRSDKVEAVNKQKVIKWIIRNKKKDLYGHSYRKNDKREGGAASKYDLISAQGGVVIRSYSPPKFKKI